MFVSRASKLAIDALIELASRAPEQWVKAEDLTNSIGVDRLFLLQIMNRLVRQSIVR
jgi:DNA-binding IscR family transcriptional regulator